MAIQISPLQPTSPYKLQPSLQIHLPFFPSNRFTHFPIASLQTPCKTFNSFKQNFHGVRLKASASLTNEIPPNALRKKQDPLFRGGFSLGVDLGLSHTGVALSKGFTFRPLTVKPIFLFVKIQILFSGYFICLFCVNGFVLFFRC